MVCTNDEKYPPKVPPIPPKCWLLCKVFFIARLTTFVLPTPENGLFYYGIFYLHGNPILIPLSPNRLPCGMFDPKGVLVFIPPSDYKGNLILGRLDQTKASVTVDGLGIDIGPL